MRRRPILLIISILTVAMATCTLGSSGHLQAQVLGQPLRSQDRDQDRAAILTLLNQQQADWNSGNVDAFLSGYWHSTDVSFSGASGIIRGWDAVLARYKKSYADREAMGQLQFSDLEFRRLGPDAFLLLGHWHLTRTKGDVGGVFSLVWQRLPEGWRIIHDHTSAVPDAK
jgi:beta-aspartyl-peptidase (threonine type)